MLHHILNSCHPNNTDFYFVSTKQYLSNLIYPILLLRCFLTTHLMRVARSREQSEGTNEKTRECAIFSFCACAEMELARPNSNMYRQVFYHIFYFIWYAATYDTYFTNWKKNKQFIIISNFIKFIRKERNTNFLETVILKLFYC